MAKVAYAYRRGGADGFLQFQTPPLKLRSVHRSCCCGHTWRGKTRGIETRNCSLNLGKRLTGGKAVKERRVRSRCIFEKAGCFIRGEIIPHNRVGVEKRSVSVKRIGYGARHSIIEEPCSSTKNHTVSHAQRLPGKTHSWRPQNAVHTFKSVCLVDKDGLVVWLVRIMTDYLERSRKPGEAASPASRV